MGVGCMTADQNRVRVLVSSAYACDGGLVHGPRVVGDEGPSGFERVQLHYSYTAAAVPVPVRPTSSSGVLETAGCSYSTAARSVTCTPIGRAS